MLHGSFRSRSSLLRPPESMRVFADMNISPLIVEALREMGWDIVRISDLLPADSSDEYVFMARRERGIPITHVR
jgi:hypothetical protein